MGVRDGVGRAPVGLSSFTISVRFSYFADTSSRSRGACARRAAGRQCPQLHRLLVVVAVLQQPSELEELRVGREDRVVHPVDVLARAALAVRGLLARLLRRLHSRWRDFTPATRAAR